MLLKYLRYRVRKKTKDKDNYTIIILGLTIHVSKGASTIAATPAHPCTLFLNAHRLHITFIKLNPLGKQ